jgi:PAS domain S-box-containing protein
MDITDHKDAEGAVRASEERFRTLLQFSFDVYWETDAQHRFTRQEFSNDLADAPAPGVEIGKTRWEVPYVEPDEGAWREHRATMDAHLPFRDFELARPMPDGGKRYVSVSGLPVFDATGRFLGYRGVGRHITDRKRSEQALRKSQAYLAEAQRLTQTGSWAYDPVAKRVTYWSDETFRIFGLDPRGGSLPAPGELRRLVHPEDLERFVEENRRALRGKDDFAIECRLVLPDGTVKHVHTIGHPVFDGAGRVVEWVGTLVDVTALRAAEEAQRAHLRFLESMDRINRAMQGINDVEQMMSAVLDAVLEIFACDRAWLLYPCDPHTASWRVVMERTRPEFPGAFAVGADVPIDRGVAAVFAAARASDGALLFGPGHELKASPVIERFTIRSQMAMALYPKGDQPYLFGVHQCSHARRWTAQEERLFREIGRRLTDALTSLLMFRSLQESERRLEVAQRIAHVGWWERDFSTNHVSLSEEVRRIFGVQPLQLPQWQQRWLRVIHPDDRAKASEAAAAAVRGGSRYDVEYRVIRPDGTVRIVHSQGDVTWDEGGRPLRQFGTLQDITELRRAEEELRASEARFRTFADHAMDAFFLHGEDLIVIDVNRQACESLGYKREELIGRHPRDFDAGLDEASIVRLAERVGAGETVTFETVHRRKDGAVFPVEISAREFQHGHRRFRLSLARDITERKRAEEQVRSTEQRYRNIFEAVGVSIWEEDFSHVKAAIEDLKTHGVRDFRDYTAAHPEFVRRAISMVRVSDVNDATIKLFEAKSKDELLTSLDRVFLPETEEVFRGELIAIAEGRTHFESETILQTLTGRRLTVLFTITLPPPPARLDRVLVTVTDISERRRAAEALQKAEAELAHVTRVTTMGELASSIAHEVNQPLAAVTTNGNAALRWLGAERPNVAEARACLTRIIRDGVRASEVVARIRALVKKSSPARERVDILELIGEVLAMATTEARRHRVAVRTQCSIDVPGAWGDRIQLQQVMLNLVMNGIEAMKPVSDRPRELMIGCEPHETGTILVAVRDSGIGFDPKNADRIFDAFYTTKADGLGMGLSISRSIIEAHGGRLSATPNEDHGVTFQFTLPTNGGDHHD